MSNTTDENFNNWTRKSDCKRSFYTGAHFYLILVEENLYALADYLRGFYFDIFFEYKLLLFLKLS